MNPPDCWMPGDICQQSNGSITSSKTLFRSVWERFVWLATICCCGKPWASGWMKRWRPMPRTGGAHSFGNFGYPLVPPRDMPFSFLLPYLNPNYSSNVKLRPSLLRNTVTPLQPVVTHSRALPTCLRSACSSSCLTSACDGLTQQVTRKFWRVGAMPYFYFYFLSKSYGF